MAGVSSCVDTQRGAVQLLSGAQALVTGGRVHLCHVFLGGLWQSFSRLGGGCDMGTAVSVGSGAGHVCTRLGTDECTCQGRF